MVEINIEKMAQDVAQKAMQELRDNGVFVGRWIPASERLPETNDDVLATDGVDMFVAWYSRKDMWEEWKSTDNNFERSTLIEAWMPLPEPYRAERSDKE